MDRRRAAAALLALAACFVCSTAAPTANDHTALELVDGRTEGCYYNFQHYGEGDRIMTNEPCLNCTCHNRMLMCYLRVCPFTKAIGQDCTVEKRADQCCPIVTCPDVPVDLLTSTSTSSPAEYGATGLGKPDKYGCSINGKYFSEGSKVPPTPNKPCEHCYCIRNMTTCVMQECTLHVDGCTPIYHKDVCCPVRYSCDHPEDEIPLLDDMTTTVRPTPGFLLTTTTTMVPVTQASQSCVHEDQVFPDGAHIKTEKACEHCYCMKGDIVCVVQGCGTPMENEGKNCTALPLRPGQCCPDTYICEGDEQNVDHTTEINDLSTMPPRRVGTEGSGYRNEPDEPFKDVGIMETDEEGSGDEYIASTPINIEGTSVDEKVTSGDDKILATTTHEDIPASQTAQPEKEQNYIPDVTGSEMPEKDILSYTTEAISEFAYTSTDMKTTISDKDQSLDELVSKKEEISTTESVSRKEDNYVTSDVLLHKEENKFTTASSDDLTEESPNKDSENTDSDEFIMESFDKKATTESIKHIPDFIDTTKYRNDIYDSQTESIYTDKQSENKILLDTTTDREVPTTSSYITQENINLSEVQTTTIDSAYNEINDNSEDNIKPARIPGEGDCLLDGITYSNNTNVPRSNNCHTSCKCMSSIIKCDPIICSPPPEYIENMNDCQPIYDSPDSCCPTYVCSAKETIPPQSHSQMSGTESPKPIETVECDDSSNCGLEKVEKHPSVSEKPCLSDDCIDKSKKPEGSICESKECSESAATVPPKLQDCSEGKCQVAPVVACEGENCNNDSNEKPISIDYNTDKELHVKDSNICNDKDGCPEAVDKLQEECANETCRRKDEPKQENELPNCSGMECKTNNEEALTPKNDVDHSKDVITEESIFDIETATNEAVVEKDENDQSSKDVIKQTEIIDVPVSVTESEEFTDQLMNVANQTEYTRLPTSQIMSDKTETENVKPEGEKHTIETVEESQKTSMDEVTEKMNVGLIYEKDNIATEKKPIYTESSQPVDLTSDDLNEMIHSVTTEKISDKNYSDIDTTNFEEIYTVSPTLGDQEITKMKPELTELEISTSIKDLQSPTDKPTDVTEISEIPNSDKTHVSEEEEEEILKLTTIPIEDINKIEELDDKLAITTDLPKSESINESHHETPVTDIEKDTVEILQTTQVFDETSTNRNIHDHTNDLTNLETTESVSLQNEMTEQTVFENQHDPKIPDTSDKLDTDEQFITDKPETVTGKLDNDLQFVTDQPEVTSSKDIPRVSMVDDESELITTSTDASQSSHSLKDEITTKSYYDITEENTQYNEISGYSTSQSPESARPDKEEKNKDGKPSYGIDLQVTESIDSQTVQPITGLNEHEQSTDRVVEEDITKIPNISIEKTDITEAPEVSGNDSELPKKPDTTMEIFEGDNDDIKQILVTETPKDSSISTEPIITGLGSTQDTSYEIEVGKPNDSEKELNAPSTQTIDLLTIKDNKEFTEDNEVLATESTPKYTLNIAQDLQTSTNSDMLEKVNDEQSKTQEQITTLQDNLSIQESSTKPQDENIQIEIQTTIPNISEEPKDQITETPESKLTPAEFDITQEILKEDELLSKKEQSTDKYSTESPEIYTVAMQDLEPHLDTTSKDIIHEEEHKPTEIEDLSEKSTWRPHIDQKDIEEEVESSTSFVSVNQINIEKEIESSTSYINLETLEEIEKSTVGTNIITEKLDNQDQINTNKQQTLDDKKYEKSSEITTEKSLTEELYPSHSTYEPSQMEASTEHISKPQTDVDTQGQYIDENQEQNTRIPEITETERISTTDSILPSQDKEPKLPEQSFNTDHILSSEVTEKLDVNRDKLPEYEESTQFEISPTVLTSSKDNIVTEKPYALVTNIIQTGGFDEIETKIETTTKIDDRIPSSDDVFITHSQEQASQTPEYADHHKIPEEQKEISQDSSLTSANPEILPSEQSYTTTLSPLHEVDVEEQNKEIQPTEQQSDISENISPTNVLPVSQQSESFTENVFAPTSSNKDDESLYEEKIKPVTESINYEETPESSSVHYIPVSVQVTESTHLELSTDTASIIDIEKDQESKVTEYTSTKPQKQFTYETIATDSVTEVYEKDKSSENIDTDITTEISKIPNEVLVNVPVSTMHPEKSTEITDLKEPEMSEPERTEINVTEKEESPTPSVFGTIPEEKETLKPISDDKITEETYDSVTENKSSASLDASTELPDKMVTDINEGSTSSLQKEFTTSADFNKDYIEKDITKTPEHISSGIENETPLSSKIPPLSEDLTSPVPITEDKQSEKDATLSLSEINIPTEAILTQKEEHEVTTEGVEESVSHMDTHIPVPVEKHQDDNEVTLHEYTYSETTPFSVELEEHTHSEHVSSTGLPISEIFTEVNYQPHEPERGDVEETEDASKSTERLPPDFEHKEKPATSDKDYSGQNVESTVIPIKLDNEIELNTDRQPSLPTITEEAIPHVSTTQTEELLLSTSQQTINEQESHTEPTEQPISIPISSAISTERDVPISSESPIKQELPQSVVDSETEVTEKLPQHVTSDKFEESMQTESPLDKVPEEKLSTASPSSPIPELAKPIFNEEPVEDVPSPDFPPSGTGGYGQEPDYVEEDQVLGRDTCRYGGKIYMSAQQIPRDDPCDFCFCFRSDIICLQQSCPPPIHGCHEEPIQGFCCPRYECPVSMATTLNMTTTTTTTTTTLPPHFLPHAYKGAAQRRGCQIKGHTYKVGEVVRASSGPCLHCTCGGDGQMKCDPKACTPEPMLRQMIAAAVSAKRRR